MPNRNPEHASSVVSKHAWHTWGRLFKAHGLPAAGNPSGSLASNPSVTGQFIVPRREPTLAIGCNIVGPRCIGLALCEVQQPIANSAYCSPHPHQEDGGRRNLRPIATAVQGKNPNRRKPHSGMIVRYRFRGVQLTAIKALNASLSIDGEIAGTIACPFPKRSNPLDQPHSPTISTVAAQPSFEV